MTAHATRTPLRTALLALAVALVGVSPACSEQGDPARRQELSSQNAALNVLRSDPIWSEPFGRPLDEPLVLGAAQPVPGNPSGNDAEVSRRWALKTEPGNEALDQAARDVTYDVIRRLAKLGYQIYDMHCHQGGPPETLYALKNAGGEELLFLIAYVGQTDVGPTAEPGEIAALQAHLQFAGNVTGGTTTSSTPLLCSPEDRAAAGLK